MYELFFVTFVVYFKERESGLGWCCRSPWKSLPDAVVSVQDRSGSQASLDQRWSLQISYWEMKNVAIYDGNEKEINVLSVGLDVNS